MRNIFTILILFLSIQVFGQLNDKEIVTKDGKKYYTYTVKKGGTLFSVCKEIGIPVDEVALLNPETSKGVKEGQKLLVPLTAKRVVENTVKSFSYTIHEGETFYHVIKKFNITEQQLLAINPGLTKDLIAGQTLLIPGNKPSDLGEVAKPTKKPDTIIVHTVLDHETLYNISKRFMVTVEELSRLNNNISSSQLKPGMTLRVPIYPKKVDEVVVRNIEELPKSPVQKVEKTVKLKEKTKGVTYLLPFNTDKLNDPTGAIATEFYMGAQLALDSLQKMGYTGKVVVMDAGSDTTTLLPILQKEDVISSDLFIGPFNGENLELASRIALTKNIQLVSPIVATTNVLKGNPIVYNAVASEITLLKGMAKYIYKNYTTEQILLLKVGSKDNDLYQAFRSTFVSLGTKKIIEITEKELTTYFKKGKNCVVVVPTRDRAQATTISDMLASYVVKPKAVSITLVGTKDWGNFDDISAETKNKLNFHYASSVDFDITSESTLKLKKLYRKKYNTALTKYAVQGFDVTLYFVQRLIMEQQTSDGVMNIIKPSAILENSGFENEACFILKQDDYKIVKVGEIND
jgi:LysM repeat protein